MSLLRNVTIALQLLDLFPKTIYKDYHTIKPKEAVLSNSWLNIYSSFIDDKGVILTFGLDMSWTLIHFKQHVDLVIHTNIELRLQVFSLI